MTERADSDTLGVRAETGRTSRARDNILRAIRFEAPESIPMHFHVNPACWHHHDQDALKDLMEAHPLLFPGYERPEGRVEPRYGQNQRKDAPYTDPWGCVWETSDDGITGVVHRHPLEDWAHFADYRPPNPEETDGTFPIDWKQICADAEQARAAGELVQGGLPHGHTFLRLQDIRGYANFVMDLAEEDPRAMRLVEMVAGFNAELVRRWLELEPDLMSYPEDLGMQAGPMLSPDLFRRHIKPVYQRLMRPAREQGVIVHMHSDGDIRTLADDLIEGGVEVINLQDLVNGIDWIAAKFAGRVCVELDIDRQRIMPHGTPVEIDALIREEVEKLGSKQGGLMMVYGLYPEVPLENAAALMDAMENYAGYYA
jgi:uroporphyrinogen decarboxylase